MRRKYFVPALGLILLLHLVLNSLGGPAGEWITDRQDPVQQNLSSEKASAISLEVSGYSWTITPVAHYKIAARVLSSLAYDSGWQSTISPVDLALGWGQMADRRVDHWISYNQEGRWFFYRWNPTSPVQGEIIRTHSSNVHVIPANEILKKAVRKVIRNDEVLMEGLLVNVAGTKNRQSFGWRTSLSRTDTGDGACEVMYLQRLLVNGEQVDPEDLFPASFAAAR